MTLDEFNKLSTYQQGALWPLCNRCRHIAQEHDEDGCGARVNGQCSECGNWTKNIRCKCKKYEGPQTLNELLESIK